MGGTANGVATISSTHTTRLRREDFRRTKHDSAFSHWKILIGPSDWEDHAQGKEGAEKYRVKNLPNCTSCPGVYELGIVLSRQRSGRETSKLGPDFIIPVYLGKTDNVRNRLQQYGREGAHLEKGCSNSKLDDCNSIPGAKGLGLFSEIFKKGYSIVYRCAPMTNSREAEKTEAELLAEFDYAWNKGSNGSRRRDDILKRIDCSAKTPQFLQKFQLFPQRRKGIKIKACELPPLEDVGHTNFPPKNLLARVLKFGRSQPILVPWRSGIDGHYHNICGVALGHGIVCRKPPAQGRKRCAEHKGMKINATSPKLLVERKFNLVADQDLDEKVITPICGVILPSGSSCTVEPVPGNKRCLEHKGRRVHAPIPQKVKVKEGPYVGSPIPDYNDNQNILPGKAGRLSPSTGEQTADQDGNNMCGVELDNGSFCRRQPPAGRKRCGEHKGTRVKKNHAFLPSVFTDYKSSPTCGMTLQNGGFCSRIPVEGNKRCWQHQGKKMEQNHTFPSIMDDKFSQTCGAALHNGTFCTRNPTQGNKRCWQHKGMKVDASSRSRTYELDYHNTTARHSSYSSVNANISQTCGAPLRNGSYCRRRSNGRCWQHRG